jgi:hypothetical protein
MVFEIGKYYRHTTGEMMAIRGELETTMWGKALIAESNQRSDLVPVGRDESSAVNWMETTEDEWMKSFS